MKRFWLGAALLFLLLGLGFFSAGATSHICEPLGQQLEQGAQLAQQQQWQQALKLSRQAQQRWEQNHKAVAAVSSHEPMEEVDALFEALEIFARQRDALRFAEYCARIASLTEAIAEAQSATWWNIL